MKPRVRNPLTGRLIQVGGKVHSALLKDGVIFPNDECDVSPPSLPRVPMDVVMLILSLGDGPTLTSWSRVNKCIRERILSSDILMRRWMYGVISHRTPQYKFTEKRGKGVCVMLGKRVILQHASLLRELCYETRQYEEISCTSVVTVYDIIRRADHIRTKKGDATSTVKDAIMRAAGEYCLHECPYILTHPACSDMVQLLLARWSASEILLSIFVSSKGVRSPYGMEWLVNRVYEGGDPTSPPTLYLDLRGRKYTRHNRQWYRGWWKHYDAMRNADVGGDEGVITEEIEKECPFPSSRHRSLAACLEITRTWYNDILPPSTGSMEELRTLLQYIFGA